MLVGNVKIVKFLLRLIYRRHIKATKQGSAAFGHSTLNKRRPGVKELADLAKISYLANAQFAKGSHHIQK